MMGFAATGSSCILHSPLFSKYSSSSSHCSPLPPFLCSSRKNALSQRKNRGTVACMKQQIPKDGNFCKRRVALLMGFVVFPLLNLRAEALESENTAMRVQDQEQKAEQSDQRSSAQNPFFSLLNELGFLGSGVLAALYALAVKEKATSDATIETMKIKLEEKEASITSAKKKMESDLLIEEEASSKALAKANEEQQSLVKQLNLANDTIAGLRRELQKEKKSVEELKIQVDRLEVSLRKFRDEKKELQEQLTDKQSSIAVLQQRVHLLSSEIKVKEENLHNLNLKLSDKEKEFNQLSAAYQQSKDQLTSLSSNIDKLKEVIVRNEEELGMKNESLQNLNAMLISLQTERDEFSKKLDATLMEYDNFKLSTEKEAASNAKLLGERDEKIHQLEEQLKLALDEVNKNKASIVDLTQEKENLREMLNIELRNLKNLEQEFKVTQETLDKSRDEASDLGKQLQQSRQLCSELEAEVSNVQAEFSKARESLQRSIDEANKRAKVLAGELESTMELLRKSKEELQVLSQDLAAEARKSESLDKELVDSREKMERLVLDLKEEKTVTSSLNKELKALETQLSEEKEARGSVGKDLEEATKSLDEMNRNALTLSRDLDLANSRISSLEDGKDALYKSLDQQKKVSQEARKNLEDAQNLVMRLGQERESLENRGKKLDEELASAKGEILRLKNQMNTSKAPANDQPPQNVEVGSKAAVPAKKVTRRRKVKPSTKQ